MPTRKHTLRLDPRGDARPYIGQRIDAAPQRFNLGNDMRRAEVLDERIRTLYRESEAVRQSYGLSPSWTAAALHAAKIIQTGMDQIPLPPPRVVNESAGASGRSIGEFRCDWEDEEPQAILWAHAIASKQYPSVKWILPETTAGVIAIRLSQDTFNHHAGTQAQVLGLKSAPLPVQGTLYEALDKYQVHIETRLASNLGAGTVEQRKSQIKYLKQAHPDRPLSILNLAECRSLFDYWTGVPKKSETKRFSRHTCKHRLSELSMFFDWLHMTTEYAGWRKPEDFNTLSKKVKKLPGKKKSIREIVAKPMFQVGHLATINRHADPLDRLLLYLGLNCSFGAAESGRLEMDDVFLKQQNPIGHLWERFDFVSTEKDSWIGYLRPKTGVAGMW